MKTYPITILERRTTSEIDVSGTLVNFQGIDIILHHSVLHPPALSEDYWTATERRSGWYVSGCQFHTTRRDALESAQRRILAALAKKGGREKVRRIIEKLARRP